MSHPTICGEINPVVNSFWDKLLEWLGLWGAISLIITLISVATEGVEAFQAIVTFLGISTSAGIWIFVILVYVVVVFLFFMTWYDSCVKEQKGPNRCLSGVVEEIFGEELGGVFIASEHPRLDLVTKMAYWPIIQTNAAFVKCSSTGSPIFQVFFKSSRICAIKAGALIGAAAGGIAGIIAGAAAAAAILGVAGCVTVILCAFALLIAALIIVAAAIVGALIGGGIASAVADEDMPSTDSGDLIRIGDYLAASGNTVRHDGFEGAIVQYYNTSAILMGRSSGSPSFSHDDPDANIPDSMDVCMT